jgi:hypothetical protein
MQASTPASIAAAIKAATEWAADDEQNTQCFQLAPNEAKKCTRSTPVLDSSLTLLLSVGLLQ